MMWSSFKDDFELDQVVLRRIQRANEDEDDNMDSDEDEENEEPDQSVLVGDSRRTRVKSERRR